MGWVADPTLVAATAKAGGFGFLAGAVMTLDEIEAGILAIKSQTDAPFGVNFHMYVPFAEDIVDLCIEQRVRAVSYSRSPSAKSVEKLKAAGVVCIPTVAVAWQQQLAAGACAAHFAGCEQFYAVFPTK